MAKKKESTRYEAMLTEVETIVQDVGSSELDLDSVVGRVERAYELIREMKARLDETRLKIENLRSDFEKKEPGHEAPSQ